MKILSKKSTRVCLVSHKNIFLRDIWLTIKKIFEKQLPRIAAVARHLATSSRHPKSFLPDRKLLYKFEGALNPIDF